MTPENRTGLHAFRSLNVLARTKRSGLACRWRLRRFLGPGLGTGSWRTLERSTSMLAKVAQLGR